MVNGKLFFDVFWVKRKILHKIYFRNIKDNCTFENRLFYSPHLRALFERVEIIVVREQ